MKHYSSLLSIALLLSSFPAVANETPSKTDSIFLNEYVYLTNNVRDIILSLNEALPEYEWSKIFKKVCDDINQDSCIAEYAHAEAVVLESLALFAGKDCPELVEIENELKGYLNQLHSGDTALTATDSVIKRACCNNDCNTNCNSKCIKFKGTKAFCNLLAQDLQVPGTAFIANLTSNQFRVTGNANISGDLTVDGTIFTNETLSFEDIVVDDLTVNGTFTTNGPVNMGADATADDINIGTAGAGRFVSIGNAEIASGVNIQANTLGITLETTGGVGADIVLNSDNSLSIESDTTININTPGGPINIGNNIENSAINIGTSGSRVIAIGNTTSGTSIALNTPIDSGVFVSGFSQVNPGVGVTLAVNNNRVGQVSYGGFTTAPDDDLVLTLSNNKISVGSRILMTTYINGTESAVMSLRNLTLAGGSATITLTNTGTDPLDVNSGIFINYWVLN
jgi:cytoskeletal protein CcmA (bactofilin family)